MFNGVDVTFNVRTQRLHFSGGTSTGKVVNDWCDIRAAVPEAPRWMSYRSIRTATPSRRGRRRSAALVTYTIPQIDVLVSAVYPRQAEHRHRPARSLPANYTLTPADQAAVAAQIGRPMTSRPASTVNLAPGDAIRRSRSPARLRRQEDLPFRRSAADRSALDIYNVMNSNMTLGVQPDVRAGRRRLELRRPRT